MPSLSGTLSLLSRATPHADGPERPRRLHPRGGDDPPVFTLTPANNYAKRPVNKPTTLSEREADDGAQAPLHAVFKASLPAMQMRDGADHGKAQADPAGIAVA